MYKQQRHPLSGTDVSISSMEEMMVYRRNLEKMSYHSLNQGCEVVPSVENVFP